MSIIKSIRINRETNLIITDPWYLKDVDPIYIAENQADGLYDVYPFKDDELGEPIGSVGVDTCQVGIFRKKDIPKRLLHRLKPFLYTEIPRFKGVIDCYEEKGEFMYEYTLAFEGKEETHVLYF